MLNKLCRILILIICPWILMWLQLRLRVTML